MYKRQRVAIRGRLREGRPANGAGAAFQVFNDDRLADVLFSIGGQHTGGVIGSDLDPKSLLGTVGWKGPVDYTVVNGKVTVRSGKLVNLDEEKAAREAAALVRDYLSR